MATMPHKHGEHNDKVIEESIFQINQQTGRAILGYIN